MRDARLGTHYNAWSMALLYFCVVSGAEAMVIGFYHYTATTDSFQENTLNHPAEPKASPGKLSVEWDPILSKRQVCAKPNGFPIKKSVIYKQ